MARKNLLDIVTTEMKNKEGKRFVRERHTYQRKKQERKM